jgi:Flp pilus assembly protein TadB
MSMAEPPRERSHLHVRRRHSKLTRRRRLARVDVGLGLLVAVVVLLATPGLAIAALVALIALVAVGISFLAQLWAARRSARQQEAESRPRCSPGEREDG